MKSLANSFIFIWPIIVGWFAIQAAISEKSLESVAMAVIAMIWFGFTIAMQNKRPRAWWGWLALSVGILGVALFYHGGLFLRRARGEFDDNLIFKLVGIWAGAFISVVPLVIVVLLGIVYRKDYIDRNP